MSQGQPASLILPTGPKNPTHIRREHRHCKGTEPGGYEMGTFERRWNVEALRKPIEGAANKKARDFGVFYFETTTNRSIKHTALCYEIERETAANYMMRLHRLGMIEATASPLQARDATLTRVYLRRIFWTEDFWNAYTWGPDGP